MTVSLAKFLFIHQVMELLQEHSFFTITYSFFARLVYCWYMHVNLIEDESFIDKITLLRINQNDSPEDACEFVEVKMRDDKVSYFHVSAFQPMYGMSNIQNYGFVYSKYSLWLGGKNYEIVFNQGSTTELDHQQVLAAVLQGNSVNISKTVRREIK